LKVGDGHLLEVRGLSFRYHNRSEYAIKDISFHIDRGEILLIAGASGCGKTTLLRCINGLIPRSYRGHLEGEIYLQGRSIEGMSLREISQMVGTVLQDPERQILGSRVVNEVAFGLENLALPREEIKARADEALAHLEIDHLRERETFYLSGGEKQKVAVAGTLAMRPSLLLLDEPLASLDPASAQEALRLIRRLADEGTAILLVEHRVEDVLRIAPDTALFMVEGEVRYFGPLAGLEEVVDYHEVKLPAPMIMEKATYDGKVPDVLARFLRPSPEGRRPLVRFEDVTFAYDEDSPPALQEVNLTIYEGDVMAILGPNGAGKTTLVKHALGLLKPTRGRVYVEGVDTRRMSVAQAARTIGYVFQSPSHMLFAPGVREELAFGPRNLGLDEAAIEEGVAQAVKILNLTGLEGFSPLALSFGQQKRVSIAAILAMGSKILAMDEPTAGQDYKNYMSFMDSILELPGFAAILFITHDLDLAICYANRVVLMDEGRIVADGPPQGVLSQPHLLRGCRLLPTSLLESNLKMLSKTGRFMRAELLAQLARSGA